MNQHITIGELSKLMNVSVHQIRYFEEKEILFPAYTDSNQYRMYGINEIYQLAQILLLRKLDIPVSTINKSMNNFSTTDYHQLLKQSQSKINSEINQLMLLQQFLQKILNEYEQSDILEDKYSIKQLDTRHLKKWIELDQDKSLTARSLYEKKPYLSHLFETDLHYLYENEQVTLCYESNQSPDIILEKGSYLYKAFFVTDDQDIEREIAQLEHYLTQHHYTIQGQLIILEKSYLSMFNNDKLHFEIQIKIKYDSDGVA
ncbi:transcriptional regulator [Paenibacillus sp. FSL R5-0345]|uniref:helix-turn-helix domain-containing protein n=1 Tax=Paenibacillus sp. FSL R5-0345 TaxID=1536770 RepID=UPI0004F7BBA5|nr:MerR family transcriptional regulator [Paenibacillus sp. FSL R5-0345]AIQ36279.1 transcriptional regulator [Paenibacillus sp. FSL R5-0345]